MFLIYILYFTLDEDLLFEFTVISLRTSQLPRITFGSQADFQLAEFCLNFLPCSHSNLDVLLLELRLLF